jgi:outer membrane protein assembly factor BamB
MESVQACREAQFEANSTGKVTFGQWNGQTVPFVAEFVNLLIVGEGQRVSPKEVNRVLAPGGVAVFLHGDQMKMTKKPRSKDIDEWTHYLYDVNNNAVSKDKRVKPPLYHLQWVGSPRWSRHHDVMSSVSACVSADNKVFYVFDEGLTFSPLLPCNWKLIARDAFNGTVLWKRDIPKWFPNMHGLKSGPATLPRRVVAVGNRVYATLGIDAPVSEIDADTGKTIRVLKNTEGTDEILHDTDALYLVVDRSPVKEELTRYPLPGTRSWPQREKSLVRFNLETGKTAWERTASWIAPLTTAIDHERVYFFDGSTVNAVAKSSGETSWNSVELPIRENTSFNFGPSLVVSNGVVVYTGGEKPVRDYGSREMMYGLSAEDGKKLWEAFHPASGYRSPEDLFVIDGKVWAGDVTAHRWAGELGSTGVFYGTDIKEGKTAVEFGADKDAYWFHHRCHMGKATEDYLLMSRTGIEFIDLKNQEWTLHHWVRGACLYGIMPANGMIYAPQHPCACYIGGKLFGFNALTAKNQASVVLQPTAEEQRHVRGPAFDSAMRLDNLGGDWPTYRGNNRRSGAIDMSVPDTLKHDWSVTLPGVTTPPVIAAGRVLVALKNKQALYCLDADSGQTVFRFFPEGRIDSPPTVYGNRVYFGSTDGHVYCVSLDDGSLVWKYQAAPSGVQHMYFENLESTHPVHGSVLVRDGKVYTVCGRSMFLDGGMRFLILDAASGAKVAEHVMDDKVPGTDEPLQMHHEFLNMPMAMPDILSCNEQKIFMRFQEFDLEGKRLELDFPRKLYARDVADKDRSFETLADQKGEDAHLFSGTGFLDDSWWHRTYWIYGKNYGSGWPGYYLAGKSAPAGRILAHDEDGIYGWGRMKQYFKWSKPYQFMLYSTNYEYEQKWARAVPILVRAMLKTDEHLYVLGPEEVVNQEDALRTVTAPATQELLAQQNAAMQGKLRALLLRVDAADGQIIGGYQLPTTPVLDGLASAQGRLYVALSDGTVTCLGAEGKTLAELASDKIAEYNANSELRKQPARKTKKKPAKRS